MTMKILAVTLALAAGPALAAGDCNHDRQAQISCATGQSWDPAAQKCVTVGS